MITTSTITLDTDCGRTPLEHLRAIEATTSNGCLTYRREMTDRERRKVAVCKARISLLNFLIGLERKS